MNNLQEQTLTKNYIYKGRILNLRRDDVLLPNGTTASREVIEHSGGAAILAVDKENNVYLTKQYRYPYSEELIEIPAGKLDKGEGPLECALRELKEETGLVANHVQSLGNIFPSPGYTDEILHLFFTTDFEKECAKPDEGEFLELVTMPFNKLLSLVRSNTIRDAKTVIAVLLYSAMCAN